MAELVHHSPPAKGRNAKYLYTSGQKTACQPGLDLSDRFCTILPMICFQKCLE